MRLSANARREAPRAEWHPRRRARQRDVDLGLSADEYERHADVWPLNPDGDLLATMMMNQWRA
jgi:hypothetical protein